MNPDAERHVRLELRGLKSELAGPFDLVLARGEAIAITGASGSGKSLFLRMVADLDVNTGEVLLDGRERASFPAPDWRRHVTYVAAESGWWREAVIDHFDAAQVAAARALASRLGVGARQFDGPVAHLSTGERLRMALVRGFVLKPPVLLLDEPTGALDPEATEAVERHLRQAMAEGTSLLVVTHAEAQVARLGASHCRMVERRLERAA